MNCSSTEALFERLLDGELTAVERQRVDGHVDTCAQCRSILAELRVVDALLLEPRRVELTPNFTFATMAETRALPPPTSRRPLVLAYLVSYVVAAWMLVGAAALLAPRIVGAFAATAVAVAGSSTGALSGFGEVLSRAIGHGGGTLGAILVALLALDLVLVIGFGAALKRTRPRLDDVSAFVTAQVRRMERLRS